MMPSEQSLVKKSRVQRRVRRGSKMWAENQEGVV